MATSTLVRNVSAETPVMLPSIYGGGTIYSGETARIADTPAHVLAAFGTESLSYVTIGETIPDASDIVPVTDPAEAAQSTANSAAAAAAAALTYAAGDATKWATAAPTTTKAALDRLAAAVVSLLEEGPIP
jgi:hypothetical protein